MKWYTAITKYSLPEYNDQLRVSLHTCIKNTKFKPNVLYDEEFDLIDELKVKYGSYVAFHKCNSEVCKELEKIYNTTETKPMWYLKGSYLRCEISQLETQDNVVLYTDTDVMFQHFNSKFNSITMPTYFSAAPEFTPTDYSYFNSGVMFMNVSNMAKTYLNFIKYIIKNLKQLEFVAHDQGALNHFYANKWDRLDHQFNWKPQWGINNDVPIIHLHGAKPHRVEQYFEGSLKDEIFKRIISINVESCKYYTDKFYHNLKEYHENK